MRNGSCYCIHIRRAGRAVTEYYDRMLKPCGITVNQYATMRTLGRLGSASVSALAQAMKLDRSTLVRTLRPLLDAGLIADVAEAGARDRELVISRAGGRILDRSIPLWEAAQWGIEEKLGREKFAMLASIVDELQRL